MISPDVQLFANKIARKEGHLRATNIIVGKENKVVGHIRYGYRKNTTDEYVPNKYRSNFGWKNTYYQNAITTVEVNTEDIFVHAV